MRSFLLLTLAALVACGDGTIDSDPRAVSRDASADKATSEGTGSPAAHADTVRTPTPSAASSTPRDAPTPAPTPPASAAAERPSWLGMRELPLRADGFGEIPPTPEELTDRRFAPPQNDLPPPDDEAFRATSEPVPSEVAARSTWTPACPVDLDDLRYVTVTFWGFDDRPHTGELLVHTSAAQDLVDVFEQLYNARFPIEEMRVVAADELDAPPTGDGNNTTAFVCRPSVGSDSWSQHASGLAVDINPFHNPYARDDVVLPELASAYVDRAHHRPGMIQSGDVVTEAFAEIGWGWGGDWRSAKDWMHFSVSGR